MGFVNLLVNPRTGRPCRPPVLASQVMPRSRPLPRPHALSALLGALAVCSAVVTCSEYDTSLLHFTAQGGSSPSDADLPEISPEPSPESSPEPTPEASPEPLPEAAPEPTPETGPDDRWCDTCKDTNVLRSPCPPQIADTTEDIGEVVFAMRTMRFGMDATKPDDWKSLGLDLDCMATAANGEPFACKRAASANSQVVEDGLLGRDNSFARNVGGLVVLLESWGMVNNVELTQNEYCEQGHNSILIGIKSWNGLPNDSRVDVAMYLSRGVYDEAGQVEIPAKWDGNDPWSVDTTSLTVGDSPKFLDDAAYVSDNVLVAHLPDGVQITFEGTSTALELALNKSTISMRLSDDRKTATDGLFTGVWGAQTALASMSSFAEQSGICSDNGAFPTLIQIVSNAPDARLDLIPKPDLACNAISFSMGFTAGSAKLGPKIVPPPKQPSKCSDAGADAN